MQGRETCHWLPLWRWRSLWPVGFCGEGISPLAPPTGAHTSPSCRRAVCHSVEARKGGQPQALSAPLCPRHTTEPWTGMPDRSVLRPGADSPLASEFPSLCAHDCSSIAAVQPDLGCPIGQTLPRGPPARCVLRTEMPRSTRMVPSRTGTISSHCIVTDRSVKIHSRCRHAKRGAGFPVTFPPVCHSI